MEEVGHAVDGAALFDFSGAAEGGDTAGFEVFGGRFMTVLPSFSWWRERERVSNSMLQRINHIGGYASRPSVRTTESDKM